MIDKTLETKLQIVQHELSTNRWTHVISSWYAIDTRRVTVKRHEHHLIWKSCWTPVNVN